MCVKTTVCHEFVQVIIKGKAQLIHVAMARRLTLEGGSSLGASTHLLTQPFQGNEKHTAQKKQKSYLGPHEKQSRNNRRQDKTSHTVEMLELSDITIEGRTRLTHGEYAGLSDISLKMLEMILGGKLKLKKNV